MYMYVHLYSSFGGNYHVCCHGDTDSHVQEMLAFSEGPVTLEDVLSMRGKTVTLPPVTPTSKEECVGSVVYLGATSALPSHSSIHYFSTGQHQYYGY